MVGFNLLSRVIGLQELSSVLSARFGCIQISAHVQILVSGIIVATHEVITKLGYYLSPVRYIFAILCDRAKLLIARDRCRTLV